MYASKTGAHSRSHTITFSLSLSLALLPAPMDLCCTLFCMNVGRRRGRLEASRVVNAASTGAFKDTKIQRTKRERERETHMESEGYSIQGETEKESICTYTQKKGDWERRTFMCGPRGRHSNSHESTVPSTCVRKSECGYSHRRNPSIIPA